MDVPNYFLSNILVLAQLFYVMWLHIVIIIAVLLFYCIIVTVLTCLRMRQRSPSLPEVLTMPRIECDELY